MTFRPSRFKFSLLTTCTNTHIVARATPVILSASLLALMPLAYKPRTAFEACPVMGPLASHSLAEVQASWSNNDSNNNSNSYSNSNSNTNCSTTYIHQAAAAAAPSPAKRLGCPIVRATAGRFCAGATFATATASNGEGCWGQQATPSVL